MKLVLCTGLFVFLVLPVQGGFLKLFKAPKPNEEGKNPYEEVVSRWNEFSLSLYKSMSNETEGSMLVSPVNVEIILTLFARYKANSENSQKITEAKRNDQHAPEILEAYQTLFPNSKKEDGVDILISATRLFLNPALKVDDELNKLAEAHFMSVQQSLEGMADWVKEKTNGKTAFCLKHGQATIEPTLVVVNANSFSGKWAQNFTYTFRDSYTTRNKIFHVDFLYLGGENVIYKFDELLEAHIIKLPLEGNKYEMIIISPDHGIELENVEQRLPTNITDLLEGMRPKKIDVYIPKLSMKDCISLNSTLAKMGVKKLFSETPGATSALPVTDIFQSSSVVVTGDAPNLDSAHIMSIRRKKVKCDRPFLFIIRQVQLNVALYISRFYEPPGQ